MAKKIYQYIGFPVSFDAALSNLRNVVKVLPQKELVEELGIIGAEMYFMLHNNKSIEEVNNVLLKRYPDADQTFIEGKEEAEQVNLIFSPQGLKMLNIILVMNSNYCDWPNQMWGEKNEIIISIGNHGLLPIIGIFRLVNQILFFMEKDFEKSDIFGVSKYFTVRSNDPASAIGRIIPLYNTPYFNEKFKEMLGVDIPNLATYLFLLYSHIAKNKPAKIEIKKSFQDLL